MRVEFWLISGKTKLRLPVNPESYAYSSPFAYTETEVESLGEVTNIGRRGLKDFTITTFWPRDYNPAYCNYSGFRSPASFVAQIENWRNARTPIRYVVTGISGANHLVTIRDFDVEAEKAGAPGDVYFTLSLKEYRQPIVKIVDTSKPKNGTSSTSKSRPASSKTAQVKKYTVKSGDSLWKIAARKDVYGDGNKWRKIYDANKKTIGKNPNKLKVGMKLVIPK
jgi:nucleoid-associated protein YgaU